MRKRIYAVFAALLLCVLMVGVVSAGAATADVVEMGDQKYSSLSAALTAAGNAVSPVTLTMIADSTETEILSIPNGKDVTLNLGGHTLSTTSTDLTNDNAFINVAGAGTRLTITDTESGKIVLPSGSSLTRILLIKDAGEVNLEGGTIGNESVSYGAKLQGDITQATEIESSLTVRGGKILAKDYGVFIGGKGATLIVDDGEIAATDYSISGNGMCLNDGPDRKFGGTDITITGGKITSSSGTAIYHPQPGTLSVTGGEITGTTGIQFKSGDLSIEAGTITGTGGFVTPPETNSNGPEESGSAVGITTNSDYEGKMTVSITGGTLTSTNGYAVSEYITKGDSPSIISIALSNMDNGLTLETENASLTTPIHFSNSGQYDLSIDYGETWSGTGAENDPFQIESIAHLKSMRDHVNYGLDLEGVPAAEAHYTLTNNIDLGGAEGAQWIPIGTDGKGKTAFSSKKFNGTFEGNGYTISNLNITSGITDANRGTTDYLDATNSYYEAGLFGNVEDAEIKNLVLENVMIMNSMVNMTRDAQGTGALIGHANGDLTLENITICGDVKIDAMYKVGGVLGSQHGGGTATYEKIILDVSDESYIRSSDAAYGDSCNLGGIVGFITFIDLTIANSSSDIHLYTGWQAGGLVGTVSGGSLTVQSSQVYSMITNEETGKTAGNPDGGFVGIGSVPQTPVTFENCYFFGNFSNGPGDYFYGYNHRGDAIVLSAENCYYANDNPGSGSPANKLNAVGKTTAELEEYVLGGPVILIDALTGEKTRYLTIQAAVDAASSNPVVLTLQTDASGNGVKVPSGSNITLDLNGYTYTIDGTTVGSSGTETNGFQLLRDSDVTIKNGTITSDKAKMLIQNYCNLTLDDVELDGSQLVGTQPYTSSNNCGNVVYKNGTKIIAKDGGVAFDSYYWPPTYADGVTVTIENNVVIEGDFEATRESGDKDGEIIIKGGTFTMDPTEFLAPGYTAIHDGTHYSVVTAAKITGPSVVTPGTPVIFNTTSMPGTYAWTINGTPIAGYTGNTLEYTFVGETQAYDKKIGVTVTDEGKITAKGELIVAVQAKKTVPTGDKQKPVSPTNPDANVSEVIFSNLDAGNSIAVAVVDETTTPVTPGGETKQDAYKQEIPNAKEVLQVLKFEVTGTTGDAHNLNQMAIVKFSVYRSTPLGDNEKIVAYRFSENIDAMPLETTYVLNVSAAPYTYDCTAYTPGFSDIAVSIVSTPAAEDTYRISGLNVFTHETGKMGIISGQTLTVPVNLNLTAGTLTNWDITTEVRNSTSQEVVTTLTPTYTNGIDINGGLKRSSQIYGLYTSGTAISADVIPLFTLSLTGTETLTLNNPYTVTISIAPTRVEEGQITQTYSVKTLSFEFIPTEWQIDADNNTLHTDKFGNTQWYLENTSKATMIVRALDYTSTGNDLWPTITRNDTAAYTKKTVNLTNTEIWKATGTYNAADPASLTWTQASENTTAQITDDGHITIVRDAADDATYFKLVFTGRGVGDVKALGPVEDSTVTVTDVTFIAYEAVHQNYILSDNKIYADVNHDGSITLNDATLAFTYWQELSLGDPNPVYLT